jgi:hypothetical protein
MAANDNKITAVAYMNFNEAVNFVTNLMRNKEVKIETANIDIQIILKKQDHEIKREAITENDVMTEDEDSDVHESIASDDTHWTATPPADNPYWLSASFHKMTYVSQKLGLFYDIFQ